MAEDRAAAVAKFIAEDARGMKGEEFFPLLLARWPGLTHEELERSIQIAGEVLEAEAVEHEQEARTLRGRLRGGPR